MRLIPNRWVDPSNIIFQSLSNGWKVFENTSRIPKTRTVTYNITLYNKPLSCICLLKNPIKAVLPICHIFTSQNLLENQFENCLGAKPKVRHLFFAQFRFAHCSCPAVPPFFLSWSLPQIESRVGGHQHACRKQRNKLILLPWHHKSWQDFETFYADTWNSLKRFHFWKGLNIVFLEGLELCFQAATCLNVVTSPGGRQQNENGNWLYLDGFEVLNIKSCHKLPAKHLEEFHTCKHVRCFMEKTPWKSWCTIFQIFLKSDAHGLFRWRQLRIAIPLTY